MKGATTKTDSCILNTSNFSFTKKASKFASANVPNIIMSRMTNEGDVYINSNENTSINLPQETPYSINSVPVVSGVFKVVDNPSCTRDYTYDENLSMQHDSINICVTILSNQTTDYLQRDIYTTTLQQAKSDLFEFDKKVYGSLYDSGSIICYSLMLCDAKSDSNNPQSHQVKE